MVQIENLRIDSAGFYITPVGNDFDIVTVIDPMRETGGITVIPEIKISGIDEGFLYTSQLCNKHLFSIETEDGDSFAFASHEPLRDTFNPGECHYRKNRIIDNKPVHDSGRQIIPFKFWDAPHRQLCKNWKALSYKIEFQTWFQYQPSSDSPITPILSFNWKLDAEVSKSQGRWELSNSGYSSIQEIQDSVKRYGPNDTPIDPCHYKHLNETVVKFLLSDPRIINGKC